MIETGVTPIRGRVFWWLLAALLPYVLVVFMRWDQLPSETDGDYAQYLLHAKALADGRPYSDIGYIYTDLNLVGPRNQPPGWPIVLAPFVALFGVHSPVIKLLVTCLVAGFAVAAGVYFGRRWGVVQGAAVTMAVPLALETGRATGSALSDPLACFLIWMALLVADRQAPPVARQQVKALGVAIGAVLVRVASVALVPAIAAHAVTRGRRNNVGMVAALLVAGIAGLLVLALWGDTIPIVGRYVAGAATFGVSPVEFLRTYRLALTAGALFPFASERANDVYHLMVGVPMLVGGLRFLRMAMGSALWWFALAYAGMLFVSPVREARYAWPLIPLVVFSMVSGAAFLLERIPSPTVRAAVPRFLTVLIGIAGLSAAVRLAQLPPRPALQDDPATLELFDVVRSLADTAPAPPRVVFSNPRVLTLETDVPAMGVPYSTRDRVISEFDAKAITHVVVPLHSLNFRSEALLQEHVNSRAERFVPVFRNSRYQLYKLAAAAVPGTVP